MIDGPQHARRGAETGEDLPAAINIVCQRRALVVGEVVVIAIAAMLASGWRSHRAMPHRRHLPRLLLACPS